RGCHALLAFKLHFEQFQPSVLRARDKEPMIFYKNPAALGDVALRGYWFGGKSHPMHNEFLAAKRGERAGPGLKAAPAVIELMRRARCEVHAAVLAVEHGCECGEGMILRLRLDRATGKTSQRLHHEWCAGLRKNLEKFNCGLIRTNLARLLQQDRP